MSWHAETGARTLSTMTEIGDREMFMATLAEACGKREWEVRAYVLMQGVIREER